MKPVIEQDGMTLEEFTKLLLGQTIRNIIWHEPPRIHQEYPYHFLANIKSIILESGNIITFGEKRLDDSRLRDLLGQNFFAKGDL